MKIIDLLNKIANGNIPKKIKYDEMIFEYDGIYYVTKETYLDEYCDITRVLNENVEIIEEDKEIEKIKIEYSPDIEEKIFYEDGDKPNHCILGDAGTELLINKINELIDKVNSLENK